MTEPTPAAAPVVEPKPDDTPDVEPKPDTAPVETSSSVKPEIVTTSSSSVVPLRDSALDRAAEVAMEMPGVPGRDEFLSLAMQARVLSMSGLTPPTIRNNPHNAFYIAMIGRDLGLSPTAAIELIDVIGRGGNERASLSPQLMNAQIKRLRLGEVIPIVRTDRRCLAGAFGPGGADVECRKLWQSGGEEHVDGCRCDLVGTTEFTWEDARIAGLVGHECQPGDHDDKCGNKDASQYWRCQQGYITYPKRMLWWRAGGYAADDYFPEAGLGLYAPEELGAMVDENGRPIDPATVEVPDGYEPRDTNGRAGGGDDPADVDEVAELQLRVRALPEEQQEKLREKWKGLASLKGCTLWSYPSRRLALVRSLVTGIEREAKRSGWDADVALMGARDQIGEALSHLLTFSLVDTPDDESHDEHVDADEPSDADEGTPEPDAPTWLSTDLSVRNAQPDDEMVVNHSDAEEVARLIARVQELPIEAVDSSLRSHVVRVAGGEDLRRKRLVLAMLRERRAREHAAQQKASGQAEQRES